jgi:glycosyltransferase involved in cell wall biosynthesis
MFKGMRKYLFYVLLNFVIIISIMIMTTDINQEFKEGMSDFTDIKNPYLETLKAHEQERIFPYRYFRDEKENILPIVAISGFYRDERARDLYQEYLDNGIKIIGITAYKSFPKPITDTTGDSETKNDPFDYVKNIENWLCCFKDPTHYGFTANNNLIDISESDFYDVDESDPMEKKYDIIYVCLDDDEQTCPANGWNAVNRNFKTAQACIPIFINEYNLNVLCVGRKGCGLEELYGNKIEVTGFLEWHIFQEKLKQSRILFVPNIYDASPRVVTESLAKGLPVIMNRNILCGSKYIKSETGELFNDEYDIRLALDKLLERYDKMDTRTWWRNHYGVKKMGIKLRDFLIPSCRKELENVNEVKMFL